MARDVIWHSTVEAVFKGQFSTDLQDQFLLALQELAALKKPAIADTPHGEPFGPEVWKLKAKDAAGQWRVIYVRGCEEALYVVNAYHKKSPSGGSEEAPKDLNNTRERLYWAETEHKVYLAEKAEREKAEQARARQAGSQKKRGKR